MKNQSLFYFYFGGSLVVLFLSTMSCFGQGVKKVPIGKKAVFNVQDDPDFKYQWNTATAEEPDFVPVPETANSTGATRAKLTILKVTVDMNRSLYKCDIFFNKKKIDTKTDTLMVETTISAMDSIVVKNQQIELKTDGPPGSAFQWQYDNGQRFVDISGANAQAYSFQASCQPDIQRYRCKITGTKDSIFSNIETLKMTGCVIPINNSRTTGESTSFGTRANGKGFRFQWQVHPYEGNGGFRDITARDSNVYSGFDKDTLKIKSTQRYLNKYEYRCIISNTPNFSYTSDAASLAISGQVANHEGDRFQFLGAMYSSIKGVQADNSANLTQVYIRANIFLKDRGIDIAEEKRAIWFRNLFIQYTYTTNADLLRYYNSRDNSFLPEPVASYRSVNRLDLLKHATHNVTFELPITTWICREYNKHFGDLAHVYVEPVVGMLMTKIDNSKLPDTASPLHVYSLLYGANAGIRTETLNPFTFEMDAKIFGITPLTNSVNPNLNYQESMITNDFTKEVSKPVTSSFNPLYFNIDGLIMYKTSKANSSNAFLHFSWYSNFANVTARHPFTVYWLLQAGYAIDINSFFDKLVPQGS